MVRPSFVVHRGLAFNTVSGIVVAMLLGAAVLALAYQTPAHHDVDIGGYDAAYVQGFADAERVGEPGTPPYLVGSNGSARWTRATSYLLFPQIGLPGTLTLHLRGWRASGPPPRLTLLLNGTTPLATLTTTGAWEEHTFTINGGVLKPNDVFIELRADTARLEDGRTVGVLLDQASYSVGPGPVTPYPAQLAYGAFAAALLWVLYRDMLSRQPTTNDQRPATANNRSSIRPWFVGAGVALLVVWFFCYRLQPPLYPYPLRGLLPNVDLLLGAGVVVQAWRRPGVRAWVAARPALLDMLAVTSIAVWTAAVLRIGQAHLTLARPGVENDFRVFATRDTLARVFQADGFYNIGYPFMLWLVRPLTAGNAFLAARILSAASGAVLLLSSYWLAVWATAGGKQQAESSRQQAESGEKTAFVTENSAVIGRWMGLLGLLLLMFSPFVVQYALYVGSDMPFAALVTLAVAVLVRGTSEHTSDRRSKRRFWPQLSSALHLPPFAFCFLAGLAAGGAFLVRHLGFVLLAWGICHCALMQARIERRTRATEARAKNVFLVSPSPGFLGSWVPYLLFALGFLLAASPQLIANTWQTGNPLYNQQAKNVWLAVYGNGDWGRWDEVPNTIGLREVILRDPGRFLTNWGNNLRAFAGTGAEDTSEFGRAIQLHLLTWPANWLAIAGVLCFGVWALDDVRRRAHHIRGSARLAASFLALIALYVVAVCMAFALPRFFLPLAPVYALAAAWLSVTLFQRWRNTQNSTFYGIACASACILAALVWPSFSIGTGYVLDGQPGDEVAIAQLVLSNVRPTDGVLVCVPYDVPLGKYSAIAHLATLCPTDTSDAATTRAADLAALQQARTTSSAAYLVWSDTPREARGTPPLPDTALVGRAGNYRLYKLR